MTDDITQNAGSGRPPGCSCHPDDRPPVCQKEHATTHCKLAYAEAELGEARTLLTDALHIIDSPVYRDSAGARPNIHPRADDIRAFLKGDQMQKNRDNANA